MDTDDYYDEARDQWAADRARREAETEYLNSGWREEDDDEAGNGLVVCG